MSDALASVRARGPLVGTLGVLVLALSVFDGSKAEDVNELAGLLGRASGGHVRPVDIRWEPSRGAFADLVLGRHALFLGGVTPESPRDVFRAPVRVTPGGMVIGVGAAKNLTQTPIGDDHALVVRGSRAAYATWAFGQEQSVTALDLAGEGAQNTTTKLHDRAMAFVTNLQQTGSGEGIGRVDVTLEQPAVRVGLALTERALRIDLEGGGTATLDLERGELSAEAPGLRAQPGQHLPKRLVFWAVDTVRAVPWIGPAPIAWLEERVFAVRDTAKQALFRVTGGKEALAKESVVEAPPSVLDTSEAALDTGHWPPADIPSIWEAPEPGEGAWTLPKQPWLKSMPKEVAGRGDEDAKDAKDGDVGDAPPPFMRTFVRPDKERPYAKVLLVAMDMRQLDLDMEAGNEDPKPLTGPPGTGRIPRDPAVYKRVAAAFNGGFKTEHGNYGMMLKKRVLLPAIPGAATVIVTKDGRFGMGSWGTNKRDFGIEGIADADVVSFRQNLDPLLLDDKVNPMGRNQWGFTLPGTSMQTERSGICVTGAGHLVYAWGDDVSATTLGRAMKMGGCVYGMHLDMNPHHTGFLFTNITEFKGRNYKSELLTTEMEIDTDRYLLYAPKDFFFVKLVDPTPPPVAELTWEPDPGAQPAPTFMAGLWRAKTDEAEVLEVEPDRAAFRVRAGTKELEEGGAGTESSFELGADDARRVLFALTLGSGAGLYVDGRRLLPVTGNAASAMLVARETGAPVIVRAKDFDPKAPDLARADAAELPLLMMDGELLGAGGGARVRTGTETVLGTTPEGRVFVARTKAGGKADAARLTALLKEAGCDRAVLIDRGAGGHGAVLRAGTASPPRSRYEDATLSAIARPLLPRGFRFTATNPYEPPQPKKK